MIVKKPGSKIEVLIFDSANHLSMFLFLRHLSVRLTPVVNSFHKSEITKVFFGNNKKIGDRK